MWPCLALFPFCLSQENHLVNIFFKLVKLGIPTLTIPISQNPFCFSFRFKVRQKSDLNISKELITLWISKNCQAPYTDIATLATSCWLSKWHPIWGFLLIKSIVVFVFPAPLFHSPLSSNGTFFSCREITKGGVCRVHTLIPTTGVNMWPWSDRSKDVVPSATVIGSGKTGNPGAATVEIWLIYTMCQAGSM